MEYIVNYKTWINDIEINGEKILYIQDCCNDEEIMEDIISDRLTEELENEFEIIDFKELINREIDAENFSGEFVYGIDEY